MNSEIGSIEEEILAEGLDDWVPLLTVGRCVKASQGVDDYTPETLDLIIDTVANLLGALLVEVGDLSGGRFEPWPISVEVAVDRVRRAIRNHQDEEGWAFSAWLCNTAQGDSLGRSVLLDGK